MGHDLTAPGDPQLAPGDARCPGPSTRELIAADDITPPDPLLEDNYEFLGDGDIPFVRYTSTSFYQAEFTKMWPRTWQWACREEHIPSSGDYIVYDIGALSFIIIRTGDNTVKAFYNSCLHRGMQLCEPGTAGKDKQFIRCPFHGFTWNLDGSLREIPCRWDFPHIKEVEFCLPEIQVALWGGFVFVNMDPDAIPLTKYLEVLPEHFSQWPLQDRYVSLHVEKVLPANWKMAMEAFIEAFHVLATHSQSIRSASDANAQYDIYGANVSRFIHTIGHPSPHLADAPSETDVLRTLGGQRLMDKEKGLPEGVSARATMADHLRKSLSQEMGVDLSEVSTSQLMDSIEYFVFPNMFIFPGITIPMVYRFRPLTVDTCIHEILFLTPVPENAPAPPPVEKVRLEIEDSYATVDGFSPGLAFVLDQDTANLMRQRAGVKAASKSGQTLGNYQEARIRRLNMTLDEYLGATP